MKKEDEKRKLDFFSSVFAEDRNGVGLVNPELAPRSGMWTGQHKNQPVGEPQYTGTIYALEQQQQQQKKEEDEVSSSKITV